jgi:hypothetical protein
MMSESLNMGNEARVSDYLNNASLNNYSFMLTIARDGEYPERSIYYFNDAITASEAYGRYKDWGFAKDYLTVRLYEPNGKINEKVLRRPPAGECTFVKADYIKAESILLSFMDKMDFLVYQDLVNEFAKLFSQDNIRFDHVRFFKATKCQEVK